MSKRRRSPLAEKLPTVSEAHAAVQAERLARIERVRVALEALLARERCRLDIAVTLTNAGNEFRMIINTVD